MLLLGAVVEGLRTTQVPCIICQILHLISLFVRVNFLNQSSIVLMGLTYWLFYAYGEMSLKSLGTPIGPYAVGVKRIWNKNG